MNKVLTFLFGYTSKAQALEMGYTYRGSYWGIPIYLADLDTDEPDVYPVVEMLWVFFYPLNVLESFMQHFIFKVEHQFMFKIYGRIDE